MGSGGGPRWQKNKRLDFFNGGKGMGFGVPLLVFLILHFNFRMRL